MSTCSLQFFYLFSTLELKIELNYRLFSLSFWVDFNDSLCNLNLAEQPNTLYVKDGQDPGTVPTGEADSDSGYSSPLHHKNQGSGGRTTDSSSDTSVANGNEAAAGEVCIRNSNITTENVGTNSSVECVTHAGSNGDVCVGARLADADSAGAGSASASADSAGAGSAGAGIAGAGSASAGSVGCQTTLALSTSTDKAPPIFSHNPAPLLSYPVNPQAYLNNFLSSMTSIPPPPPQMKQHQRQFPFNPQVSPAMISYNQEMAMMAHHPFNRASISTSVTQQEGPPPIFQLMPVNNHCNIINIPSIPNNCDPVRSSYDTSGNVSLMSHYNSGPPVSNFHNRAGCLTSDSPSSILGQIYGPQPGSVGLQCYGGSVYNQPGSGYSSERMALYPPMPMPLLNGLMTTYNAPPAIRGEANKNHPSLRPSIYSTVSPPSLSFQHQSLGGGGGGGHLTCPPELLAKMFGPQWPAPSGNAGNVPPSAVATLNNRHTRNSNKRHGMGSGGRQSTVQGGRVSAATMAGVVPLESTPVVRSMSATDAEKVCDHFFH